MWWKSLYISCDDQQGVVGNLQNQLTASGYELFDPFDGVPGKPYPQIVRLFIAPPQQGWMRILGDVDPQFATKLSNNGLCLLVEFNAGASQLTLYELGASQPEYNALFEHLVEGCTADHLLNTLNPEYTPDTRTTRPNDVAMDWLPDDVQQMADNLNPKQVNRLFNRFMNKITDRLGADMSEAQALLRKQDWNSPGARQTQAVMACLPIPNWNMPDFVTLRDAYQLHRRLERKPNAQLFPGEAEALRAVPDALGYQPVYGGKQD